MQSHLSAARASRIAVEAESGTKANRRICKSKDTAMNLAQALQAQPGQAMRSCRIAAQTEWIDDEKKGSDSLRAIRAEA